MKLKLRTVPENYANAKFDFHPTTRVVSANTQFAPGKVSFFVLFGPFDTRTGRTGGVILMIYT